MARLLSILLLLGALACFGLLTKETTVVHSGSVSHDGVIRVHEPREVPVTRGDRIFFALLGIVFLVSAACLFVKSTKAASAPQNPAGSSPDLAAGEMESILEIDDDGADRNENGGAPPIRPPKIS